MAHAYTIYPAKPAFGNFAKHLSYSEVLANKRTICVWPNTVAEKDINEMILAGTSAETIHKTIMENACYGASAVFKLMRWRRC